MQQVLHVADDPLRMNVPDGAAKGLERAIPRLVLGLLQRHPQRRVRALDENVQAAILTGEGGRPAKDLAANRHRRLEAS